MSTRAPDLQRAGRLRGALGTVSVVVAMLAVPLASPAAAGAVPDAPTLAYAEQVGNGVVGVEWEAPVSAGGSALTSYTATASPGGATCTTTDMTPGEEFCSVAGLTVGVSYSFTVVATNSDGTGSSSAPSAAVTVAPFVTPGKPGTLLFRDQAGVTVFSWTAAPNNGPAVVEYTVQTSPDAGSCSTFGLTCSIAGLNGGSYQLSLVAENAAGAGPWTGWIARPFTPPQPSTQITVSPPWETSADVTWKPPPNTAYPTYFTVTSVPDGKTCTPSNYFQATWTSLHCTVFGLRPETTYVFVVTGSNALGSTNSALSGSVTTRGPGDAPTITSVIATNGSAAVTWATPPSLSDSQISQYQVDMTGAGAAKSCFTTSHTCSFTGLQTGSLYKFVVWAWGPFGLHSSTAQAMSRDTIAPARAVTLTGGTGINAFGVTQMSLAWRIANPNDGRPVVRMAIGSKPPRKITDGQPVRVLPGPRDPRGGKNFIGKASAFRAGPVAVSVFMVDAAGNVSAPKTLVFVPTSITVIRRAAPTLVAGRATSIVWLLRGPGGKPRARDRVTAQVRALGTRTWKLIPLVADGNGRVSLRLTLHASSEVRLVYGGGPSRAPAVSASTVIKVVRS